MKERKSSRPEGLVQVRPSPARPGPALNREIQTKIGQQLRAVYDDIVDQGVPDRFADLLRNLDTKVVRTEGVDKDASE
ncbi:hypothetical protein GJ689_17815 [Rhodoplanes serenus]|uniref:Anti-sigma factor NepR domain-containing protein n=1 Tax=Rhodoplanes serenus TaxID=200615 RepID=A0A9X4XQY8_9BRAD|nr:NepR family anti-sigma factor [Rhodoplanes serenus]MTW18059.1 hypothetical protein [Rhodoplanes serenus]